MQLFFRYFFSQLIQWLLHIRSSFVSSTLIPFYFPMHTSAPPTKKKPGGAQSELLGDTKWRACSYLFLLFEIVLLLCQRETLSKGETNERLDSIIHQERWKRSKVSERRCKKGEIIKIEINCINFCMIPSLTQCLCGKREERTGMLFMPAQCLFMFANACLCLTMLVYACLCFVGMWLLSFYNSSSLFFSFTFFFIVLLSHTPLASSLSLAPQTVFLLACS